MQKQIPLANRIYDRVTIEVCLAIATELRKYGDSLEGFLCLYLYSLSYSDLIYSDSINSWRGVLLII